MKKTLKTLLICAFISSSLTLCSCNNSTLSTSSSPSSTENDLPTSSSISNTQNQSDDSDNTSEETSKLIEIDPFEGIQLETIGISPYCNVVIDTENCNSLCHSGIRYTFDKTRYSNGEEAVITASFKDPFNSRIYTLTKTEFKYTIPEQPKYITSADGIDLSIFEEGINNYITARNAETIGYHWFWKTIVGSIVDSYKSIENGTLEKVYFISIRKNFEQDTTNYYYTAYETKVDHFNSFNFIYSFDTTTYKGVKAKVYVNIVVPNIVRHTDGSIKWGKASESDFKLVHHTSDESMDFLISSSILKYAESYKITEIETNK